jgi:hypothetical protein
MNFICSILAQKLVTADGTYATQSAFVSDGNNQNFKNQTKEKVQTGTEIGE